MKEISFTKNSIYKKVVNILIILILFFLFNNYFNNSSFSMKNSFLSHNISFSIKIEASDFFSDIPPDHWAYQAIVYLYEHGLIKGYSDNTFKGDNPMTRYEIAYFVYNVLMYLKKENNIKTDTGDFQQEVKQILAKSAITVEEAKLIKDLIAEFKDELLDLNKRVTNLEKRVDKLENNRLPLYVSIVSIIFSTIALIMVFAK